MRTALVLTSLACASGPAFAQEAVPLRVESPAFAQGGAIPVGLTCKGDDLSPPLAWSNVPASARTLAIVLDDPDAPGGTFTHWVVKNIPATVSALRIGAALPPGAVALPNDAGRRGYSGPCPPSGRHRYIFRVYALDLAAVQATTRSELFGEMRGHVVGAGVLVGTYAKR